MNYRRVFVAGTFDQIHKGHEALLQKAFDEGKTVTIGLTSDQFVKNFKSQSSPHKIKDHNIRKLELKNWLEGKNFSSRATVIPINDPYEPAASEKNLNALVVSTENKPRGQKINKMRVQRGLPPLVLLEVGMIKAQDGKLVSSTRIRLGEVDTEGKLTMPELLRPELAQPLGTVLTGSDVDQSIREHKQKIIITVGDVATKTLLDAGIVPHLLIVDFRVGRKPYTQLKQRLKTLNAERLELTSGPGSINVHAIEAIDSVFNKKAVKSTAIIVAGEEDLLALPAIKSAPLGSIVYYGQPASGNWASAIVQEGLVEVEVTKDKKQEIVDLLKQFT